MLSTPLRSSLARLTTHASNDLNGLWRQVDTAVQAREALASVLPALVDKYGIAASALAAEWYDDLRTKRGVGGSFRAIPAHLGASGTDALAGWGVAPLFSPEPQWDVAKTLIAGGLQRRIANHARITVARSSIADPKARGWQRETAGGCDFCEMLAGRGSVYSEASADFASHDHCQCQAVPAF